MTIIPRLPIWLLSRRALARISMMVRFGLSSIQIGASASRPMAREIFCQSSVCSWPLRTLVESTRASAHSSRWDSSRLLISREKNSTGDGFGGLQGGVGDHPEGEGRLAHGGTGAHHDERAGLEPGQEVVEVEVAGGRAGDGVAPLVQLLEAVEVVGQQLGELLRAVGDPPLVDLVDQRLGAIERLAHVLGHGVAELGDLSGHRDQAAEQRVLLHDLGVAPGVGRGRRRRHDLGQHRGAADAPRADRPAAARRPP